MKKLLKVLAILGIVFVVVPVVFMILHIPALNLLILSVDLNTGILMGIGFMLVASTLRHILG